MKSVLDVSVWHKRPGHPCYLRIDVISDTLGTTKLKNKDSEFCHTFYLAKQENFHIHLPIKFVTQILSCYILMFGDHSRLKRLMDIVTS